VFGVNIALVMICSIEEQIAALAKISISITGQEMFFTFYLMPLLLILREDVHQYM
jgi:hypothetical protein